MGRASAKKVPDTFQFGGRGKEFLYQRLGFHPVSTAHPATDELKATPGKLDS
jgi:hypothetical protein